MSDANGNPLFRLKRGTLDMGFEGEHPDGKGKFFKVHKKAFSGGTGSVDRLTD